MVLISIPTVIVSFLLGVGAVKGWDFIHTKHKERKDSRRKENLEMLRVTIAEEIDKVLNDKRITYQGEGD